MTKRFDLEAWHAELAHYLPRSTRFIGTTNTDPLVRWSEAHRGPLRMCSNCKGAYTTLGLNRHKRFCTKE